MTGVHCENKLKMSKKSNQTLSDKLAELANPTPTFIDPEDEYNEETKARLDQYDEEFEYETAQSIKPVTSKSNLRQKNSKLLAESDGIYAAKRISRKDLEQDSENSGEELSDDGDDNEDINVFKTMLKTSSNSKKNVDSDEEASEDDSEGEDAENEEEEGDLDESGDDEDVDEDIDEEGEEEEDGDDEEHENSVQRLPKNSLEKDVAKGKSIQNQLSLWDHLLECRIKIHKGIQTTNQLPQGPSDFKLFSQIGEKQFVSAAQVTQSAVKTLLDSCLELQDLLLKSNPQTKNLVKRKSSDSNGNNDPDDEEIPSDTEEEDNGDGSDEDEAPRKKKLKIEEYECEIQERHQQFKDYCNKTLHQWNDKTKLAAGRSTNSSKSGFGAFEQPILKQIESILSDKQRLINRTRIKRSDYRVLGKITSVETPVEQPVEQNIEGDAVPSVEKVAKAEEFDAEIYDDDDFYHQLLRELIERRTIEGGTEQVAHGRQWLEIQKLRAKAKRRVDPKASKGRRLRYQIHPKLVSFMAPYPETSWNDVAKNELFASLFATSHS